MPLLATAPAHQVQLLRVAPWLLLLRHLLLTAYCLLRTTVLTAHQVQLLLGSLAVVAAFSTLLLPERRGLALPD